MRGIGLTSPFLSAKGGETMPKALQELEVLCDADKRKNADELPFISAHMLHDLYLRWSAKHK